MGFSEKIQISKKENYDGKWKMPGDRSYKQNQRRGRNIE
jgi:hypothetical protein